VKKIMVSRPFSGKKKQYLLGEWQKLTAVDGLGGLLGNGASVVLLGRLVVEAGSGAVVVEVAALVHGLLEGVVLPAEDVVTVSSRATGKNLSLAGVLWVQAWRV